MATRKQIAAAFKAAKELTAVDAAGCLGDEWHGRGSTGRFEFICHALEKIALPGARAAKEIIRDRFHVCGTTSVYVWLMEAANIPAYLLTDDNVQAYKHRWLDSVIKEFSK